MPNPSPPIPIPGTPLVPSEFAVRSATEGTAGYILNHVALHITSRTRSFAFYVDFLGLQLIFAISAGPFVAYYLGYPGDGDTCPADIARTSGSRSGLLELISTSDQDEAEAPEEVASDSGIEFGQKPSAFGFAHLGFRVPDVSATLERARSMGWEVLKPLGEASVDKVPLPGCQSGQEKTGQAWIGGFEKTIAQIGFVKDPDG